MLMDEPFGAVDPIVRERLQGELLRIQRDQGTTVLFVTHDIDEAIRLGDRIAIMKDGKLVQYAPPGELLAHPANDFVAQFVGSDRGLKRLGLLTAAGADLDASVDRASIDPRAPLLSASTTLRDALARMLEREVQQAPVVDEGWPLPRRADAREDREDAPERRVTEGEPLIRWDWIAGHLDEIGFRLFEHVELTAIAMGVGFAIAFALSLLILRMPRLEGPVTWITGTLYTIPSLALFALLIPYTGLSLLTAEIGLVSYTLLILIRNIVRGIRDVPADVLEAATGMGYAARERFWRVEVPLAMAVIFAGIRVATITTIGLVTVTALIGQGGMGYFILLGIQLFFSTALIVGALGSVALAIGADALLVLLQRRLTPWTRVSRTNLLVDTLRWFADPAHYSGRDAVQVRILEHLELSGLAVVVATAIALPIGCYLGHTGRLAFVGLNVANIGRALPSLALLAFGLVIAISLGLGLGFWPTVFALVPLAIPPILTNSYVAIREVDRDIVDAARGMGLSDIGILRVVELPLALPLMLAGIRTAAVNVVATATLGALVAGGALGRFIVDGLALQEYDRLFAGALLVAALAIGVEVAFATFKGRSVSPGLRSRAATL